MVMFIENPKMQGMIILNNRKIVTERQTNKKRLYVSLKLAPRCEEAVTEFSIIGPILFVLER